jgi:hypothetical protein
MRIIRLLTLILLFAYLSTPSPVHAQRQADTLSDALKIKALNSLRHFTFGFYIDAYYNATFGGAKDTSNLVPFSANCPVHDQIRLNVAAIQAVYNADRVRGKLQLQFGDAPNLMAAADAQWIKNIRQAYFGFRIVKNLWVDAGYMFTPVGYESAWPVMNQISTATVGGYYEPGSVLGVKISWKISNKIDCGFMFGDPYSLAYAKNTHIGGILFFNYSPISTLQISYSNLFGNQALVNASVDNNILYNNLIITYSPAEHIRLVSQVDFAVQTNSALPPDTNQVAGMVSGFLQAQYIFNRHFSLAARYQIFDDPNGFLSGSYVYDGKTTGLFNQGADFQFEYKPVEIGYVRLEYRYAHANKGNNVYYSKSSDAMQAVVVTAGVFF